MIRRPLTRITALCLFLVAILTFPVNAFAQEEDFRRGIDARGDRRWSDVVRYMQAAIKTDGKESAQKIRVGGVLGVGAREFEYLPYYFLGEAFSQQQNCVSALNAWDVSEQQGIVKVRSEFVATIRKESAACAARGVLLRDDLRTATATTQQTYEGANILGQRVLDLINSNQSLARQDLRDQYDRARSELDTSYKLLVRASTETRLRGDFDLAQNAADRAVAILKPVESSLNAAIENLSATQRLARDVGQAIAGADAIAGQIDSTQLAQLQELYALRANALDQLTQARARLDAGQRTQNQATLQEAMKLAQSASTILNDVVGRLARRTRETFEQQFTNAVKALEESFSFVGASMATIERLAVERPGAVRPELTEQSEKLRKEVEALRRRFDRARASEDLPGIERTLKLTADIRVTFDTLIKSFGPVTLRDRGVNASLEEAARLFLAGDYQKTLVALNPPGGLNDILLQLHVHLFRAAAHYGLWVRSGGTDQSQRDQAAAEIARCKQLNSTFLPDPRAFSPSFIAFYQQGGVLAAAAATQVAD